jgi:hypothetical protein
MSSLLTKFSKHIFWDVDISKTNPHEKRVFIIQRVSEYGLLKDWKLLVDIYGIKQIAEVAATIRTLDRRTASYIACMSDTDKNTYQCYITTPLIFSTY